MGQAIASIGYVGRPEAPVLSRIGQNPTALGKIAGPYRG
ncbi:hypothetical protein NK6_1110 [Bradyrhizobium diazoefficiens]|uniref:Uncharacterized protein n=1 Tax=Bradyrhizobium diazoefficiens TaxID=1355477 RepID=A0A0E3VSQ0_9BRAD|nr:hypothetical protein NK6_1110 [Bradyrhizobium diazoefficiens]